MEHSNQDQDKEYWVDAEGLCQIVLLVNEVGVLIKLIKWLSKVAVTVGILLVDIPKKVSLKATGD